MLKNILFLPLENLINRTIFDSSLSELSRVTPLSVLKRLAQMISASTTKPFTDNETDESQDLAYQFCANLDPMPFC